MSPIDARRLALVVGAAFALRLGVAVLTETHPLFPAFYYTDARLIDAAARVSAEDAAQGRPRGFSGTLSQRLQVRLQSDLYRVVGIRPFAVKLADCALGALGVAAFVAAAATAFGTAPALAAAALYAAWPSNVFYTSQNFKEAPTNLLALLALAALLPLLDGRPRRGAARALAGLACLLAAGAFRSHVMLALCAGLAPAFAWAWLARRAPRPGLAMGLAATLCAPALYLPVSRFVLTRCLSAPQSDEPRNHPQLLPVTYDDDAHQSYRPTSPRALSEFRRLRQESDRQYALTQAGREIGTQVYPDARFATWLDVLFFLPKGAFSVLFMPLPGAYPMDGKPGRMVAAAENLLLLALAALGLAGAARGPRTPARAALLIFFAAMTCGSALLEFDLGSAGRHKILYLAMLLPFAAEEALRLLARRQTA